MSLGCLGLFGGASAKRETRNRTQLRHVCHLQLDFWTYRRRFHLSLSYCQKLHGFFCSCNIYWSTVAAKLLHQFWCETFTVIAWLTTKDLWLLLRNFAPVLVWNFYGDCPTDCVRLMAFAAKLCTSSGVKLLRWLPDWLPTTYGFCCETLHQFLCETFTVIAWLITCDLWLLLRNYAPVIVWNFYGDCLTDYLRLLRVA